MSILVNPNQQWLDEFMQRYLVWGAELERMLKTDLLDGTTFRSTPVGDAAREPVAWLNRQEPAKAFASLMRLGLLVQHLQTMERGDRRTFARLRKRLRSARVDEYIGARCEALVAHRLLRERLEYRHEVLGGADFTVTTGQSTVGIECTSVHLTAAGARSDYAYKLVSAITTKSAKPYASRSVGLVIEHTSIAGLMDDDTFTKAVEQVSKAAEASPFGAVILTTAVMDQSQPPVSTFMTGHNRLDSADIDPRLTNVLDKTFSVEAPQQLEGPIFPSRL